METSVGTPFYLAPEVARGDAYDEKVDVYAFGLILLAMAVEGPILDFVRERYRLSQRKESVASSNALPSVTRVVWKMQDGWRPVTDADPVPNMPPLINSLIVHCSDVNPSLRPSFDDVLQGLAGSLKAQAVSGETFPRFSSHPQGKIEEFRLSA